MTTYIIECSFALEQTIRHWLSGYQGEMVAVHYSQIVQITLNIPEIHAIALQNQLKANICKFKIVDKT
jgi:putative IMPACT (imprinted ancient) family translation regulator